jgi:hypothetical protein
MNQDICQVNIVHENRIAEARRQQPPLESVARIAAVHQVVRRPSPAADHAGAQQL